MINPTRNKRDFIGALRVFVGHGLIENAEIVRWADSEISKTHNPDDYLIELSFVGGKTNLQTTDLLRDFIGGPSSITTGRAIVGLTWAKIQDKAISYKKGFDVIHSIQGQFPFTELEANYISHADDALELANREIWGDKDEVEKEVRRFLGCYDCFSFDNADTWDRLAIEVVDRLNSWNKETET